MCTKVERHYNEPVTCLQQLLARTEPMDRVVGLPLVGPTEIRQKPNNKCLRGPSKDGRHSGEHEASKRQRESLVGWLFRRFKEGLPRRVKEEPLSQGRAPPGRGDMVHGVPGLEEQREMARVGQRHGEVQAV